MQVSAKALFGLVFVVGLGGSVDCRAQNSGPLAPVNPRPVAPPAPATAVPPPVKDSTPTPTAEPAKAPASGGTAAAADHSASILQTKIDAPPVRKLDAGKGDSKGKDTPASDAEEAVPVISTRPTRQYVIGPLDVLMVKVWGQTNLTGPLDVGPDGMISMNLIGDVRADGLTKEQLKAEIAKRLGEFLNNPEVDVQVLKNNSKRYFVIGAANRTGEFPLVKTTTVLDALSGGGLGGFANAKKIYVLRETQPGKYTKFFFNYKQAIKGEHMEKNIVLQDGDRIIVPE